MRRPSFRPFYCNVLGSVNEYGWDPVENNVVYAHANLYELDIFIEDRSSKTNLLSVANGTLNVATRQTENYMRSRELGSQHPP